MPKVDKKFYVYIILTVNNKLYCGYTDDVERRYKLHKEGKAAKYTKANKPFKLVYVQEFNTKNAVGGEKDEVEDVQWLDITDINNKFLNDNTKWAFKHNILIKKYLKIE